MKWSNLKKNKCPQCDKDFMIGLIRAPFINNPLLQHPCGFKIRERRYSQIVTSQVTKELEKQLEEEQKNYD